MTMGALRTDRAGHLPGYYPLNWPVKCGGNCRQKAALKRAPEIAKN